MEPRDRIITKSIELFTKAGIRLVTMDQIAAAVGMSKRTIYELFKDKDEILSQCIQTMNRQHESELHEIISQSANAIEAIYLIGQHGENKKASINWLFFDDLEKLYPGLRQLFIRKNGPGNETVTYTILKRGIDEGIFIKGLNLAIVDIFIHEMMRIVHARDTFPVNINAKEIIENIVVPYFRGISTNKGRELIEKHFPFEVL
jgi:AcrR family transcriptional regulator